MKMAAAIPVSLNSHTPTPQLAFDRDRERASAPIPKQMGKYPEFRYMGSKSRLIPWIYEVLDKLDFESAADPFSGSGCVSYLLKTMGKRVVSSDFLNFPTMLAKATVENNDSVIDGRLLARLLRPAKGAPHFIESTFTGIFYTPEDLRFLDRLSHNIAELKDPYREALAKAALIRSCLKKQPRGVFTVGGNRYDDGRRDLRLSLEQHFLEQVEKFNSVVFDNGLRHRVIQSDAFEVSPKSVDLVYLDPPYVPRADDNCYVKRYHFLEGLSCYWEGLEIMEQTKVKKIQKKFTPFSYRKNAVEAFDRLFHAYRRCKIVLSYSSNGYPDLAELESLLRNHKSKVEIYEKPHRYHFGTHKGVERSQVSEYLLVGY